MRLPRTRPVAGRVLGRRRHGAPPVAAGDQLGAAPATDVLLRRMAQVFPDVTNVAVFGQTEMSPVTCLLSGRDALRKLGSVGRPVATVAAGVVDAALCDVAPGAVGEIVYRRPTTTLGYWNNPAATALRSPAGGSTAETWSASTRRASSTSSTAPRTCSSPAGERVLRGGRERPRRAPRRGRGRGHRPRRPTLGADARRGSRAAGPVVAQPAGADDVGRERLAGYTVPRDMVVLDALPRNASGKVVEPELRAAHGG